VSKRTGRYGDPPHPKPASTPGARPGGPSPAPAFGERKGAPLPLLTQPMVAVETREITELQVREAKQTIVDGPATTTKLDPALILGTKLEAAVTQGKLDAAALVHGKPTVMISPQAKPSGTPPQIDLTQHHLPDDEIDSRLAMLIDPDSDRSASFRVLRHHLLEVGRPQVVIVTSPQYGDGKTTTAVNLALALAECGRAKTLLVETHVRRPQLTTVFQFVPPWCFAEQLAAHRHQPTMPWSLIDIPQLWLHVAAINPRTEQTQLLDGPAFAIAMERLRLAGYDHIVVDAPPVLGSADVNLIADAADSVIFSLRARRSNTRDLRRALEQLGTEKFAGVVLLQDD
jgi:Mrp family chromosome partitioning ATPase